MKDAIGDVGVLMVQNAVREISALEAENLALRELLGEVLPEMERWRATIEYELRRAGIALPTDRGLNRAVYVLSRIRAILEVRA